MVEKFKNLLNQIVQEKGDIILFAVMKMDEFTDKWSILISANWINGENSIEVFQFIRNLILQNFDEVEKDSIARIVMLSKDEHLVSELLNFKSGSIILDGTKINGNFIHEAYILASHKESNSITSDSANL